MKLTVLIAVFWGAALAEPSYMKCKDYSTENGMIGKPAAEDATASFTLTVTGTGADTKLVVAGIPAGNLGAIVWVTGGELTASTGFTAVANCKTALHTAKQETATAEINWNAVGAAGKKICVAHANGQVQLKMKCANAPAVAKKCGDSDPENNKCMDPHRTCAANNPRDTNTNYCSICWKALKPCLEKAGCNRKSGQSGATKDDQPYWGDVEFCKGDSSAAPVLYSPSFVTFCTLVVSIAAALQL